MRRDLSHVAFRGATIECVVRIGMDPTRSEGTAMSTDDRLTAEEFAARRYDLADAGRWMELVEGSVVSLGEPDLPHGTAVLNLSKALAAHLAEHAEGRPGYACFDLGVVTVRGPDTVRFPAVSYFAGGTLFAESEKTITETAPALVVEVASTSPRREKLAARVSEYHTAGVRVVWVIDTLEKRVHVAQKGVLSKRLAEHETLLGRPVLAGFRLRVGDLFAEPAWWK
jgi:Uma2 family endonuclease